MSTREVKANGYNLNIPLYVDTFEDKEIIDLAATAKKCQEINRILKISTIDSAISLFEERKVLMNQFKSGILQKFLNQEISFKERGVKKYPAWIKFKLGDLLTEVEEDTSINNQHDVLSSTMGGVFLQSEYFNHNVASVNNIGYKVLRKKHLVLSPQNLWLGNINVNMTYDVGIVSPSYKVFQINTDLVLTSYLNYIIKTPRMLYQYKISSEQGASVVRRNLVMYLFYDIPLKIPTLEEQNKIVDLLINLDYDVSSKKIAKYCEELNIPSPF